MTKAKKDNSNKSTIIIIIIIIILLAAISGWGYAIKLQTTSTPRLEPKALKTIKSNQKLSSSDSDLVKGIERRRSVPRGKFTGKKIDNEELVLLGWSATGKNREGTGFVVPLAKGAEPYISLYLVQKEGVRQFDWKTNQIRRISDNDIRDQVNSGQEATATWVYVIDKKKIPDKNMNYAWHTIGAMSEHQYLVADELNIDTRFMSSINSKKVAKSLNLDINENEPVSVMLMAKK